jgi:hypothetical protein
LKVAWIKIEDIQVLPWRMILVDSKSEATLLSSADAREALFGAQQNFADYRWKQVSSTRADRFVVEGKWN